MPKYKEIQFSESDVVNIDDWIPKGEYNPHNVRPFLIHDHGFAVCVVFADCEQDALDAAVDADKLDRWQIHPEDVSDRSDYMTTDPARMAAGFDKKCPEFVDDTGTAWYWEHEPCFLGNASEPFDIETLGIIELPNPPRSFCAQWSAAFGK